MNDPFWVIAEYSIEFASQLLGISNWAAIFREFMDYFGPGNEVASQLPVEQLTGLEMHINLHFHLH